MSLVFRIFGRNTNRSIYTIQKCELAALGRAFSSNTGGAEPAETHDERNMRMGRPQSPHLSIYKPQLRANIRNSNTNGSIYTIQRCELAGLARAFCSEACQDPVESHDERNMRKGRPQSPHLSIYKPQLTALLSITQRATGLILSAYLILFALAAALLPDSISSYIEQLECEIELGQMLVMVAKFFLALPLCYHFWNGIRHLIWDTNTFLSLREVYATGYIMLIVAAASAVALVMLY